jgi:uncharacterized membrane protein
MKKKSISLWLLSVFYLFAGINHFINPDFYLPLIPPYLPLPNAINYFSGLVEILLGLMLIFSITKKWAAYGITFLLIAFIPSHIYFIQINSCVEGGLCVPTWLGWVRLIVIHPLLLFWAWNHRN